jgi:hypothetical protein
VEGTRNPRAKRAAGKKTGRSLGWCIVLFALLRQQTELTKHLGAKPPRGGVLPMRKGRPNGCEQRPTAIVIHGVFVEAKQPRLGSVDARTFNADFGRENAEP